MIRKGTTPVLSPRDPKAEISSELRFHRESEIERLMAEGLSETEAATRVDHELGDVTEWSRGLERIGRRRMRRETWMNVMTSVGGDVRLAIRNVLKRRASSVTAMLTLALGAGAAATVFSVVYGILWRPLPYPNPESLVRVGGTLPSGGLSPIGPRLYFDWSDQSTSFADLTGVTTESVDLLGVGDPARLTGAAVSQSFAAVVGLRTSVGRWFDESEARRDSERVVVLGHDVWLERWGGDAGVVGRTIQLDGSPVTVIGVLDASFQPPATMGLGNAELWYPLQHTRSDLDSNRSWFVRVLAHLRSGVTLEAARNEMMALTVRLEGFEGAPPSPRRSNLLEPDDGLSLQLEPLRELTIGDTGRTLLPILGAVGLLLLLAGANVAHLQLGRVQERAGELAVRRALGASRWRIMSQLGVENATLALGGGLLGIVVAQGGVTLFRLLSPPSLPRLDDVVVDGLVVAVGLVAIMAVGCAFGMIPALVASKEDPALAMRQGGRGLTPGGGWLRRVFVMTESALAMSLMVGAGLLVNSFVRLTRVDPGFDADEATVVHISLSTRYGSNDERREAFRSILEEFRAIPGVEHAGISSGLPFGAVGAGGVVSTLTGAPADAPEVVGWQVTDPGFFRAIRVLRPSEGRLLTEADLTGEPVVLVNEAFARAFWPEGDGVGQQLQVVRRGDDAPWWRVVGILPDFKQRRLDAATSPEIYLPYTLAPVIFSDMEFVVRGAVSPALLRNAVWAFDPVQPVAWVAGLDERIARSVVTPRFYTLLLSFFATVALLLAAIGVFGTLAHHVASRTREIGVRMSLGADRSAVARAVVVRATGMVLGGVIIGIGVAVLLTRWLSVFLFDVEATDPLTYAVGASVLMLSGLVAAYIPSRRATRVDPATVLRD